MQREATTLRPSLKIYTNKERLDRERLKSLSLFYSDGKVPWETFLKIVKTSWKSASLALRPHPYPIPPPLSLPPRRAAWLGTAHKTFPSAGRVRNERRGAREINVSLTNVGADSPALKRGREGGAAFFL